MRLSLRIAFFFVILIGLASLAQAQAPPRWFEYRFTSDEADNPLVPLVTLSLPHHTVMVQSVAQVAPPPPSSPPVCTTGQCAAPVAVTHHHGHGCQCPMCCGCPQCVAARQCPTVTYYPVYHRTRLFPRLRLFSCFTDCR